MLELANSRRRIPSPSWKQILPVSMPPTKSNVKNCSMAVSESSAWHGDEAAMRTGRVHVMLNVNLDAQDGALTSRALHQYFFSSTACIPPTHGLMNSVHSH